MTSAPKPLMLAVQKTYFDQIKTGEKTEEYRDVTPYWEKKLIKDGLPIEYSEVVITYGYPKKDDPEKTIKFPWNGWVKKEIIHPHFGDKPINVFAIKLSSKQN